MIAAEVRPGDRFEHPAGRVAYTVELVELRADDVVLTVRYSDGGNGRRRFYLTDEVSLVRADDEEGQ